MNKRVLAILCGATAMLAMPANAGSVTVSGAWFRSLPGNVPAGGYFTLKNTSNKPIVLTGASAPACASLDLHMTHNMGGMVHMMAVPSIEIGAAATFAFAPGGHHLMCMKPSLKIGTSVPVTLKFANGESLSVPFAVKNAKGE